MEAAASTAALIEMMGTASELRASSELLGRIGSSPAVSLPSGYVSALPNSSKGADNQGNGPQPPVIHDNLRI